MNFTLTKHAQRRMQQRAVPGRLVLEPLLRLGAVEPCGGGAERVFFDSAAIKCLRRELGGDRGLRAIERWLGVYVIISAEGVIITVAHSHRRTRRR